MQTKEFYSRINFQWSFPMIMTTILLLKCCLVVLLLSFQHQLCKCNHFKILFQILHKRFFHKTKDGAMMVMNYQCLVSTWMAFNVDALRIIARKVKKKQKQKTNAKSNQSKAQSSKFSILFCLSLFIILFWLMLFDWAIPLTRRCAETHWNDKWWKPHRKRQKRSLEIFSRNFESSSIKSFQFCFLFFEWSFATNNCSNYCEWTPFAYNIHLSLP